MFEIIIIIVIIVIIKNNAQKKKNNTMTGNNGQVSRTISSNHLNNNSQMGGQNVPVNQSPSANGQRNYQRNYASDGTPRNQGVSQPVKTALGHGAQTKPQSKPQPKTATGQEPEIIQGENESTTDYLERKARMDAIEHKKEAMEQKRAERENYGDLVYALRWMEGDPVPSSQRLVKCSYCGAENLVPTGKRIKYHCYFCREEL